MKKTLSFYVIKETIGPFFVGFLVFDFIFLMNAMLRLTELVVNKGVNLVDILKLIFYTMPSFLVFTIPMVLLMAVLTALGRLSGDNEITAMKAAGISLYELLKPIMVLSMICYVLSSLMIIYALPWANYSYNELIFNIAKTKARVGIKERTFNNDFEGLVLYVDEVAMRGKKLKGVLVSQGRDREEPHTIMAKEGYIISDPKSLIVTLRLIDGNIHRTGKNLDTYQKISFDTYNINLNLGTIIKERVGSGKEYKEMSVVELLEKIKELREKKEDCFQPLRVLYEKFSLPFTCLVFGLLSIPLGVQSKPSGNLWGFVLSLGVILIYYIILAGGEILAGNEMQLLPIALWAPNLCIGTLGIYMLYKSANESPIKVMEWARYGLRGIRSKLSPRP